MSTPLDALTDTWNAIGTAFTAIRMAVTNTASAAGSRVLSIFVNDVSVIQQAADGNIGIGLGVDVNPSNVFGGAQYAGLALGSTMTKVDRPNNVMVTQGLIEPTGDNLDWYYGINNILYGASGVPYNIAGGLVANYIDCEYYGSGNIGGVWGSFSFLDVNSATIGQYIGSHISMYNDGGATVGYSVGYWISDMSGTSPLAYPFWYDGRGVWRVKDEGTTKGSVVAWYNPNFTKYTPGAVNFERGILQWNTGDILEIGAEAGGMGTLRKVRHLGAGHLFPLANLPTSDPGVAGQIYTVGAPSAGVPKALMISGG